MMRCRYARHGCPVRRELSPRASRSASLVAQLAVGSPICRGALDASEIVTRLRVYGAGREHPTAMLLVALNSAVKLDQFGTEVENVLATAHGISVGA